MFLHTENQQLLWQTLQKSPYLIEFSQKFAGYREEWFRGAIEQFYTQWISRNNRVPSNAKELLEINKHALLVMVADLKRLLGYPSPLSSRQFGSQGGAIAVQSTNTLPTYNVAASDTLPTYDINAERKHREDQWTDNFNKYQTEYNQLLERPAVPTRALPSKTGDEKIKNMEELVKEHAKMRDMDLSIYSQQTPTTQIPKLKIMDELENIEMHVEDAVAKKTVRFTNENSSASQ